MDYTRLKVGLRISSMGLAACSSSTFSKSMRGQTCQTVLAQKLTCSPPQAFIPTTKSQHQVAAQLCSRSYVVSPGYRLDIDSDLDLVSASQFVDERERDFHSRRKKSCGWSTRPTKIMKVYVE